MTSGVTGTTPITIPTTLSQSDQTDTTETTETKETKVDNSVAGATQLQAQLTQEQLSSIDTNNDGVISPEELAAAERTKKIPKSVANFYKDYFNKNIKKPEEKPTEAKDIKPEDLEAAMDLNHDGIISDEERQMYADKQNGNADNSAELRDVVVEATTNETVAQALDLDGNGEVDESEIAAFIETVKSKYNSDKITKEMLEKALNAITGGEEEENAVGGAGAGSGPDTE